jgi:hypothetical protein
MKSVQALALMLSLLMTWQIEKESKGILKDVEDSKYKPGQVWTYKTRPGEEKSTLTILRVEAASKHSRIVHIRLDNIRLRSCNGGNEPKPFEHMPFAQEALDQSVVKNIRSGPVPDFKNGYSEWRQAWPRP